MLHDQYPYFGLNGVFDARDGELCVDGTQVKFTLRDTQGQEDYDRLRALSYNGCDSAIICFSVDSSISLSNVTEKVS